MDDFSLAQRTVQTSLCIYQNFRKARFLKQREGPYTSSESATAHRLCGPVALLYRAQNRPDVPSGDRTPM